MTKQRIDELTRAAFGIFGNSSDLIPIIRSELRDIFGYIHQAEKRHLKQVTRFRRASDDDFNMGMHDLDHTDIACLELAKKHLVIIFSNKGFLVMQTGHSESGLFPGSKVTEWVDTEIVDIFNG